MSPKQHKKKTSMKFPSAVYTNGIVLIVLFSLSSISCRVFFAHMTSSGSPQSTEKTQSLNGSKVSRFEQPELVFEEYRRHHSIQALERNNSTSTNRKYAIGLYSCPYQAGNRIFHFLNHLIWAIATNRTLLWKYYDIKTCRALDQSSCYIADLNSESDCDKVLHRASWIPSYDEYSAILNLSQPTNVVSFDGILKPKQQLEDAKYRDCSNVTCTGPDNDQSQVVMFPGLLGAYGTLALKEMRESLLVTEEARERAKYLHRKGKDFLYGMLFRGTFQVTPEYSASNDNSSSLNYNYNHPPPKTYALHSRHTSPNDIGLDITKEIQCLRTLWMETNRTIESSCLVYIMSDRKQTIEALRDFLELNNCSGVVANHTEGKSVVEEHGPFAGGSYFTDLSLVVNARDGFIGHHRTSSGLVKAVLEYDRSKDAQQQEHDSFVGTNLPKCFL